MAFDVSKFLALTVLIAGTGAACSGTDDKDEPAGGAGTSTSGSAGQSSAGSTGNQAGAADAGNGGAAVGGAGEGGGPAAGGAGGAGVGGESLGGAANGGAGGAVDVGECLGALAAGGAGGAGAVEVDPSLEGLCSAFYQTDCGNEGYYAPSYNVCEGVRERAQPAVAVAVADCITALSAADECDGAKVAACFIGLEGKGCANADGAAACTAIKARVGCEDIVLTSCEKIADLISADGFESFTECMDPAIEGWYDPEFAGTCAERLDNCAGVRL